MYPRLKRSFIFSAKLILIKVDLAPLACTWTLSNCIHGLGGLSFRWFLLVSCTWSARARTCFSLNLAWLISWLMTWKRLRSTLTPYHLFQGILNTSCLFPLESGPRLPLRHRSPPLRPALDEAVPSSTPENATVDPGNRWRLVFYYNLLLLSAPYLKGHGCCVMFNKLTSVFHASVLLLIINFVITLSK